MSKWHAQVAYMAKHMSVVGGPLWWGTLGQGPLAPTINPALYSLACAFYRSSES